MEALQAELRKEKKERKSLERKNARLQEKLDFANKNRFGSKSQKVKDHVPAKGAESSDRTQDEDNFDGTPGSITSEVKAEPAGKDVPSKERDYETEGLGESEKTQCRNSLETKSLLIDLRLHLDLELARSAEERSGYLTEALNYLQHFWKELTAFLLYGTLPIDNNIAERTVRCMTTARYNSLHYGSDVGAEMTAAYHSIIGTVKLHGKSVWGYLGEFF